MTQENLDQDPSVVVDDVNVDETPKVESNDSPQPSQYEIAAREMGWRPKDEWEGDPEKWRDSKEFVERGELYGKIDNMGRELKETRKALKLLQEHNLKIKETEYNRAVEELKSLQKKHLESGDSDGYLETTELLTDLKAEQKARQVYEEAIPKQPQLDPRFVAWTEQNKWYANNQEMREYADTIGQGYANRHQGIDPVEVLKYVTKEVQVRFKDKFQNPNRDKPNAVEGAQRQTVKGKSSFELSDDERKVMNTFVRTGVMTKEEYIDQLKQMKGNK
jgi:hypothetical protein